MKFHLPSFLLGCVTGAGAKALAPRLRPLMLQLATAGYKMLDVLGMQAARRREDLEDILAEARARARSEAVASEPTRN